MDTRQIIANVIGKRIRQALLVSNERWRYRYPDKPPFVFNELRLDFDDGTGIALWDHGQRCCELRHMTCDDDLSSFKGAVVYEIEERDGGSVRLDSGYLHETMFLVITTDKGAITLCTHNEHNGCYDGFLVVARDVPFSN